MRSEREGRTPRRAFLFRLLAAGGGIVAAWIATGARGVRAAAEAVAEAVRPRPGRKHDWVMVFVPARCIDCGRCADACNARWEIPERGYRTEILSVEQGKTRYGSEPAHGFLPVLCNHCDVPHCVLACPTRATYKREEDGVVIMDPKKCIGCKTCMIACPYNARYFSPKVRAVDKCNYCRPKDDAPEDRIPSCVEACPAGVRFFGDLKDPKSKVYDLIHNKAKKVWTLRPEAGTVPRVFYVAL